MALYSMRITQVKRSKGQSAVAAAAYRAGEKLFDERTQRTHDYSRRHGVERTEIMLPDDAPEWVRGLSREALWNAVEAAEKRKDSQPARELRIMIPRELPPEERIQVIRDFLQRSFVSKGMIVDVAWHNKISETDGLEQPHAHALMTTRVLTDSGFGKKSRHDWVPDPEGRTHADGRPVMVESNADSWNSREYYENCRTDWQDTANAALARVGSEARIDKRSLLERGLSRLPEPALRLAWYMKDLYGVMRERFGQFQVARHYGEVEKRAQAAFKKMGPNPALAGEHARTAARWFDWFERQLERLAPAGHDPGHDRDRARHSPPSPEIDR